jgi:hypothetical protein
MRVVKTIAFICCAQQFPYFFPAAETLYLEFERMTFEYHTAFPTYAIARPKKSEFNRVLVNLFSLYKK